MIKKNITEFFADEVRGFSVYNCQRSIPSGIDGLKISQRKVIFGMLKKFPIQEVKVSIASAGIMEISAYHHGSLDGVITNMACGYPGTNNEPLLEPIGQFGSRLSPDAAASRYIFTKLSKNFRKYFRAEDDAILNYLQEDDEAIEPDYYLPVLPMILVNGATGMGTGFACSIASYNPNEIQEYLKNKLQGKKTKKLIPWYRGFKGTVEKDGQQIVCTGVIERKDSNTLVIHELPIGTFAIKYRETLNALEDKGIIKSYTDESNEEQIKFVVKTSREVTGWSQEELLKTFKLVTRDTENLTVWTENGKIRKFETLEDLMDWFFEFRITKYEERRLNQIQQTEEKLSWLEEQIKFIRLYLKNASDWSKRQEADILKQMEAEGFVHIEELLRIPVRRLSGEAIDVLRDKIEQTKEEMKKLKKTTDKEMFLSDLNTL